MNNETMIFLMPKEDADVLQKIFDESPMPDFSIVKRFDIPETSVSSVEIVAESSLNVWFLIKKVEADQSFERRLKEIEEDAMAKIKAKHEEILAVLKERIKNKQNPSI